MQILISHGGSYTVVSLARLGGQSPTRRGCRGRKAVRSRIANDLPNPSIGRFLGFRFFPAVGFCGTIIVMPHVTRDTLQQAVNSGIVSPEQAEALWQFLETRVTGPAFTFTNVLYYLGGMIAIGAMSLFMTLGWQTFGGWGICAIAIVYAMIALGGAHLLNARNLKTPAGILAALAVVLVPLAIYGAQAAMGSWDDVRPYRDYHYIIDWRWAFMELGTLFAGALILYAYRLPFAVMPLAVTLWYMSMDFAPLLAGGEDFDWKFRKSVSMIFGLAMIALALFVDVRSRRQPDYGFWLYLFGMAAFWGALSMSDSNSQLGKFLYGLLNTALIFVGAILARRVFTVFGGLGLCGYLGYLSYNVFKDSVLFPIALTALGLAIVGGGIWWQRNESRLRDAFRSMLPAAMRETLAAAD